MVYTYSVSIDSYIYMCIVIMRECSSLGLGVFFCVFFLFLKPSLIAYRKSFSLIRIQVQSSYVLCKVILLEALNTSCLRGDHVFCSSAGEERDPLALNHILWLVERELNLIS